MNFEIREQRIKELITLFKTYNEAKDGLQLMDAINEIMLFIHNTKQVDNIDLHYLVLGV